MSQQTDPQIVDALSKLKTPAHRADFWESLEREMTNTKPTRLASAEGRSRVLMLSAAAAIVIAATVGVITWQGAGTSLETVSPITDLPTLTGTGEVEGPFPFVVLEPASNDRLFVSRAAEFDELPPCFANEDESDRAQVEILVLDMGRAAASGATFPEAPTPLAKVQNDWIFQRLITPGPNSTHLVHNDCRDQAVVFGLYESGEPSAPIALAAPDGHIVSHATWGVDGNDELLSVTFFEDRQSDGPLSYIRRVFDARSGQALEEESAAHTVVAHFADGTEIASGNNGLVVGGVATGEFQNSGWATAALSPNGTLAAVFPAAFSDSEVLVIDSSGAVVWRERNGTPIDASWLSNSQLVLMRSDDSNISEFSVVDLSGPTPSTSTFDPGLGPITARSLAAAPGDRLAISGTNRSAADSTWFVPAPSTEGGSGGQENTASNSQSGDDLTTLAPPVEDFGPGWGDPFINLLPPGIELFDPAELSQDTQACAALDPVVIPSGYIIEYGYNESPDDGFSILAEGTSAEIDQLFDVFTTLECVTALEPGTTTDSVEVAGAERAVIYDGEDDIGQVSQGIVADFGQQLLVLDLAIQTDTGQIDLVSILEAHLATR